MATQKFTVQEDYSSLKKGDVVQRCYKNDYGITGDDTRILGEECVFISPNGDYPATSIPIRLLKDAP